MTVGELITELQKVKNVDMHVFVRQNGYHYGIETKKGNVLFGWLKGNEKDGYYFAECMSECVSNSIIETFVIE